MSYQVTEKMRDFNYKTLVGNKEKNSNANMLKSYCVQNQTESESEKDLKVTANGKVLLKVQTPRIDKESPLELGTYRLKESVSDVRLVTS